jgi:hypothetical protein
LLNEAALIHDRQIAVVIKGCLDLSFDDFPEDQGFFRSRDRLS